jgi:hypothetical protein
MEFIKTEPEPEPDDESYLTSAYDQIEITGVREDEDPLLVKCPFIKTESEVSCKAIVKQRYRTFYHLRVQDLVSTVLCT